MSVNSTVSQKPIRCRRRSAASEELLHDAEDQIGLLRLWHYVATGNLDEASIRNAIGELTRPKSLAHAGIQSGEGRASEPESKATRS